MGQDILITATGKISRDSEPGGKYDFVKLVHDTAHSVNTVSNISAN